MSFINEQGRIALTQVAEWLESGAPHIVEQTGEVIYSFNMSTSGQANSCGTACCIAGAVVAFNPDQFPHFKDIDSRTWYEREDRVPRGVFEEVKEFAGLKHNDAVMLFEPSHMLSRTAKQGAEVIRKFLTTGDASWPRRELF